MVVDLRVDWIPGGCVFYEPVGDPHTESTLGISQDKHAVSLMPRQPVSRHPPIGA